MNGMISCNQCLAHNSLDSAFCKKCGATLPEDEIQAAKDKLEATVADGYKIFSAGRTDEAMQVAETATVANPLSTAALSLKAMCHERKGEIAEALECHERVVEIDPDSMIDKIKIKDLKNLLVARSSIAAVPDRRMAIMSAIAAFVLVASIVLVFARPGGKGDDKVAMNEPTGRQTQSPIRGSTFEPPTSSENSPGGAKASPPPTNQAQPQDHPQPEARQSPVGSNGPPVSLPNYDAQRGDRTLPSPSGNIPVLLNPDDSVKTAIHNRSSEQAAPPPTKTSVSDDPPPQPDEAPAKTQSPPGVMEIKVVGRGNKTEGDDPGSRANGVEALIRTARSQYQIGNYSASATSYERALRAGADSASGNQRLAQCYEKLGRNAEAIAAYHRAIDALQAAIDSGHGDKDRLSAALESCKQAAKVLGG